MNDFNQKQTPHETSPNENPSVQQPPPVSFTAQEKAEVLEAVRGVKLLGIYKILYY
jgi:hypothetical protein